MERHRDAARDRTAAPATAAPVAPNAPAAAPGKRTRVERDLAIGGASASGAHAAGARARTPTPAPAPAARRAASGTTPPATTGDPAARGAGPGWVGALAGPGPAPAAPTARPAPGAAPTARPAPGGGDPLAGLVDPFMKARWNPAVFWALVSANGLPGSAPPEVVGELDRWLPLALSPDARRAIHIAAAFTSGAIDDAIWQLAEKMPAIGPLLGVVHDVAGIAERIARYEELDDPAGALVAAVGGCVDVAAGLLDHVAAPLEAVAGAAEKVDVAAGVVEAASAAGGPLVAGGIAVKATAHAIAEAVGVVTKGLSVAKLGVGGVRRVVDVIEIGYDATRARGLEARAQFDRAGEYKDLMQGQALDLIVGTVKSMIDVGGMVAGTLLEPVDWVVPAGFVAGQVVGAAGSAVDTVGELTGALRDAVGPDAGGLPDVRLPIVDVSLADALRSDRPYLAPARTAGDPGLDAARTATVADAAAAQAAASGARPDWHPELVDAIAATPAFAFATAPDRLRPTWYIEQAARAVRLGATGAGEQVVDGLGAAIDAVGAGLQPAVDLAVLGTNRFLSTNLPPLQQLAVQLDGEVQRTRVDLAAARGAIGQLEHLAATGRHALGQLAQTGAAITGQLLGALAAIRVDLPDLPGLDLVEAAIRDGIAAAREAVVAAYARGIVPLEIALLRLVTRIERDLADLRHALAQGGAVHQFLEAQLRTVKDLVHRGAELFGRWQPVVPRVDVRGAGTWLRDLAAKWRAAVEIERGQRPDPWAKQIVPTVARPAVAAWKAAHTDQLARAYYPAIVPPSELAAAAALEARGTAAIARLSPAQASIATPILADAYAACTAMHGRRGRPTLVAQWDAQDHLLAVIRQLEGWAGAPGAAPTVGP